jgi:hypothetical protein
LVGYFMVESSVLVRGGRAILSALQRGDGNAAWNSVSVSEAGIADLKLLDKASMVAALNTARPTFTPCPSTGHGGRHRPGRRFHLSERCRPPATHLAQPW